MVQSLSIVMLNMDTCAINVFYNNYIQCCLCTFLQGDRGLSAQEKRATITLNRSEITDTEGYSDLPAHNVSTYFETFYNRVREGGQPFPLKICYPLWLTLAQCFAFK